MIAFLFIFLNSFLICQNTNYGSLYFSNTYQQHEISGSIPIKYPLSSLLLPGLGQYQLYKKTNILNQKYRSFVFLGIEIISLGAHFNFRNKHNQQKNMYKDFADDKWDFIDWINGYDDFQGTDYEYIWQDDQGNYTQIGESSHYVQFYFDDELIRTTDSDFSNFYATILNDYQNGVDKEDIYNQYNIRIIKDQHFYENIGKYNEFFSGWEDGNVDNIIEDTTEQSYNIALSPQKNKYIDSYKKAESFSDISEVALTAIYFNHFISMLDAFVLARKFGGNVKLDSSTIYEKKTYNIPIGVQLRLSVKL